MDCTNLEWAIKYCAKIFILPPGEVIPNAPRVLRLAPILLAMFANVHESISPLKSDLKELLAAVVYRSGDWPWSSSEGSYRCAAKYDFGRTTVHAEWGLPFFTLFLSLRMKMFSFTSILSWNGSFSFIYIGWQLYQIYWSRFHGFLFRICNLKHKIDG